MLYVVMKIYCLENWLTGLDRFSQGHRSRNHGRLFGWHLLSSLRLLASSYLTGRTEHQVREGWFDLIASQLLENMNQSLCPIVIELSEDSHQFGLFKGVSSDFKTENEVHIQVPLIISMYP